MLTSDLCCAAPAGYPRIVESPSLKAVEKDRNTVMLCGAVGTPEPTVTWVKDYLPVDLTDPRLKVLPTGGSKSQVGHGLRWVKVSGGSRSWSSISVQGAQVM